MEGRRGRIHQVSLVVSLRCARHVYTKQVTPLGGRSCLSVLIPLNGLTVIGRHPIYAS